MKVESICPTLFSLTHFTYSAGEKRYSKISLKKSQYSYRLMIIEKGEVEVCYGSEQARLKPGDVLYLLPSDVYSISPCGSDFSLYNLFFHFSEYKFDSAVKYGSCVFLNDYNAKLCVPIIEFEDADVLNVGSVFRGVNIKSRLDELAGADPTNPYYTLLSRGALFSIISELLAATSKEGRRNAADRVLAYIRANVEGDLSGDALARVFSYHKNYINKLIRGATGKSLSDYVRYVKIEYAKTLMSENIHSLTEVAASLGYYDYSHFYKAFCAEVGITPREYSSLGRRLI